MDAFSSIAIVLLAVGLVLQAVGSLSSTRRERARSAARLDELHRKVDAIAEHLDVGLPVADHADLVALIAQGRTVDAVRTHRRQSGAGLAEAAQFVQELGRSGPRQVGGEAER